MRECVQISRRFARVKSGSSFHAFPFLILVLGFSWLLFVTAEAVASDTTGEAGVNEAARSQQEKASSTPRVGSVAMNVQDRDTGASLGDAVIDFQGTETVAETDDRGYVVIRNIPVGSYSLLVSKDGYDPILKTDIIVKSGGTTQVGVTMRSVATADEITVTADSFEQSGDNATSTVSFSREEVRRSPGSAGDVSRIIGLLPSVAKVNDQMNSLAVRGGSPYENGFYLDGMEVPNINHYPTQGSTGGPISIINVDFVQDVTFSAGGFSALYGDRLSSVMDMTFREGNRDSTDLQIDMNMAGFGLSGEGPVPGLNGTWLFSARRSYLDLLVDAIGTGVAPRYSDYQGKLIFDAGASDRIELLAIAAVDSIASDLSTALEDEADYYGSSDIDVFFSGLIWQHFISSNGFNQASISFDATEYRETWNETIQTRLFYENRSQERTVSFRDELHYTFSTKHKLTGGFEVKSVVNDLAIYTADYVDPYGNEVPAETIEKTIDGLKTGVFIEYDWRPSSFLESRLGLRYDHSDVTQHDHLSPRLGLTAKINDQTAFTAAWGQFYQAIPYIVLAQDDEFRHLKDPMATHYIVGMSHLLTPETRLTVELFDKEYENFPLNPDQPLSFPADGSDGLVETLFDNGKASARGVELILQKKRVDNFYGMVSGSWSRSMYRDFEGTWRPRRYDNRLIVSLEGGYKLNPLWDFSVRWVYAGGRPYTPLDEEQSQFYNREILDQTRVNEERMPAYHTMNLRCDRRFDFTRSNLIVFLDLWNVYNRKNVASYYWNAVKREQETSYQWSFIPILGIEWEF